MSDADRWCQKRKKAGKKNRYIYGKLHHTMNQVKERLKVRSRARRIKERRNEGSEGKEEEREEK